MNRDTNNEWGPNDFRFEKNPLKHRNQSVRNMKTHKQRSVYVVLACVCNGVQTHVAQYGSLRTTAYRFSKCYVVFLSSTILHKFCVTDRPTDRHTRSGTKLQLAIRLKRLCSTCASCALSISSTHNSTHFSLDFSQIIIICRSDGNNNDDDNASGGIWHELRARKTKYNRRRLLFVWDIQEN